jgi:hypothetical protein
VDIGIHWLKTERQNDRKIKKHKDIETLDEIKRGRQKIGWRQKETQTEEQMHVRQKERQKRLKQRIKILI